MVCSPSPLMRACGLELSATVVAPVTVCLFMHVQRPPAAMHKQGQAMLNGSQLTRIAACSMQVMLHRNAVAHLAHPCQKVLAAALGTLWRWPALYCNLQFKGQGQRQPWCALRQCLEWGCLLKRIDLAPRGEA